MIIQVKESTISVIVQNETDYINLTDITSSFREGSGLIGKWISNKNTLEYLSVWEKINNRDFRKFYIAYPHLLSAVKNVLKNNGTQVNRIGQLLTDQFQNTDLQVNG